jgi:hypothetical protein
MALTKRKLTKKIAGDVGCNQKKASEILLEAISKPI